MGGISVLVLMGLFAIIGVLIIAGVVGIIAIIIGVIVNAVSLKRKRRRSLPAIIIMTIGGGLLVPLMAMSILVGISMVNKDRERRAEIGEIAYSIEKGNMNKLDSLLASGADPDGEEGKIFPLEIAVKKGNLEVMRKLLNAGANPNAITKNGDSLLLQGLKEATYSTSDNYIERAKLLIEYGADPTARSEGSIINNATALIILADKSNSDKEDAVSLATILLEKGVDINAEDSMGDTALILACENGNGMIKPNVKLIKFLIENGADVSMGDYVAARSFKECYEGEYSNLTKDAEYYNIVAMLE